MKQPKLSDLSLDRKGTKKLRNEAARSKKVRITINIDSDSLTALRGMAEETGAPYQKLLNRVLREGLAKQGDAESRLDRLEKELAKIKKKVAA